MKLYLANVQLISSTIIDQLCNDGSIEVTARNKAEAESDLTAVMEEFLRRDRKIMRETKDTMSAFEIPYDQFSDQRSKLCKKKGHPTGKDIEKYLARQFIESFMMSNFVDEVYASDEELFKKILPVLRSFHVDENQIREEAKTKIANFVEGTVEYEMALRQAILEVKRKKGLLKTA